MSVRTPFARGCIARAVTPPLLTARALPFAVPMDPTRLFKLAAERISHAGDVLTMAGQLEQPGIVSVGAHRLLRGELTAHAVIRDLPANKDVYLYTTPSDEFPGKHTLWIIHAGHLHARWPAQPDLRSHAIYYCIETLSIDELIAVLQFHSRALEARERADELMVGAAMAQ